MSRAHNLAALGGYLAISIILVGLPLLPNPAWYHVGFFSDPSVMIWCMEWWPHAILHLRNPFITKAIWAPGGYNLLWATSMPALALLFSPVTLLFGPVVSYNAASLVAPAMASWGGFFLCRRLTRNFLAAFAGGLLFGFSPYQYAHVIGGHPLLTFGFFPPVCVLLVMLLVDGEITDRRFAVLLATSLVIQCLISTEVLATMTLFGASALLLAIAMLRTYSRRLLAAIIPIGSAYVAAAIVLSPFWYYAFLRGSPPKEPIFPATLFSSDLLNFVIPARLTLINGFGAQAVASRFAGNIWENGSYLSIPLLAVGAIWLWRHRRASQAQLLGSILLIVLVSSLGPMLQIERCPIMRLPWILATKLPLIRHALPARLANYAFLILAIIFASWLSEPFAFKRALGAATLVALFPRPASLLPKSTYNTPAFFTDGMYGEYLRPDENVLILPFGRSGPSMAWQAESSMYFRMTGGYIGLTPRDFLRWPIASTLLYSIQTPDQIAQMKAFAAWFQIGAVIVADAAKRPARELPAAFGITPLKIGGVSLYRLAETGEKPTVAEIERFQRAAAQRWFLDMLCTARRFVNDGRELASLDPSRAYALGLLPHSDWADDLDFLIAGLPHSAYNGLWIGPGAAGTIAVGVPASGDAARALADGYRNDAAAILYPYPHPYSDAVAADDTVRFMLMDLRPAAFGRCDSASANWLSRSTPR
jgi:hypothetical protein